MPFKHNTSRRHHIPKARRRIINWPAYEAGLRRRGDLTFWLDETAPAGGAAPPPNRSGGPTDLRRHGHRGGADTEACLPSGAAPGRRLHPLSPAFVWTGDRRARPLNAEPARPRLRRTTTTCRPP